MITFKELDRHLEITDVKKESLGLVKAKELYEQFYTDKNVLHLFYYAGYDFQSINKEFDFTDYDKVILDFSGADDYLLRYVDIDIVKSKIKSKETIVVSKNAFEKEGYIYNDPLIHRIKVLDFDLIKKDLNNSFLFLGGHARWHRLIFLEKLLNNKKLDKIMWSMRRVEENDFELWRNCIPLEYKNIYKNLEIHNLLPKNLDFDVHDKEKYHGMGDSSVSNNPGYVPNLELYEKTYIEIISESVFEFAINPAKKDKEYLILSEKTFKPLSLGFPFFGLTLPNSFSKIKEWGFELFDEVIDYSFDLEYDDYKRMQLIIEQVEPNKIREKFLSNFDSIYKKHMHNKKMFLQFKIECLKKYEKSIL